MFFVIYMLKIIKYLLFMNATPFRVLTLVEERRNFDTDFIDKNCVLMMKCQCCFKH
jgi:hypothetical protein